MTLNQALAAIRENLAAGPERSVFLACGFQPLHLATFLRAQAAQKHPASQATVLTGLYGDLPGNLARAAESEALETAVVVEWSDIDPRLGLRGNGGWGTVAKTNILADLRQSTGRLAASIRRIGERKPVAVCGPSLPLPPIGHTIGAQASRFELELRQAAGDLLLELADSPGVRIVNPDRLDELSPSPANRLDARLELLAGFPYTNHHASALAHCLAEVLWPPAPKKGLITDLDDTLWAGIVGEVGCHAISWTQEHHTQAHGLYQQMLGHLADCGVLLAVTSKNELSTVQEAFARQDLLLNSQVLYPVFADWGKKSRNVAEVLRVWNIGPRDVVFVDDNPMELSEVEQAFPGITCLRFPAGNDGGIWELLCRLRDLLGKPVVMEEDRIRRESIRAATVLRDSGENTSSPEFLRSLQGLVTIDFGITPSDKRAIELLNKTNQFNLNGVRLSEGEWQKLLEDPATLAATVSYKDKFGPLGKIGLIVATSRDDGTVDVLHWVMSCRAFSRRIEHHSLDSLVRRTGARRIRFEYRRTDRNQPLQEFFAAIGVDSDGQIEVSHFESVRGELPHQISEGIS